VLLTHQKVKNEKNSAGTKKTQQAKFPRENFCCTQYLQYAFFVQIKFPLFAQIRNLKQKQQKLPE
jgi:hypothetical protein